jgi:hypothetical protein
MRLRVALALALSGFGCKQSTDNAGSAPSAPPLAADAVAKSIFRAQYDLEAGIVRAGTIFSAKLDPAGPVLAITAHHVFGTLGGLRREIAPDELVRTFAKGEVKSVANGSSVASLGKPLLIPEAKRFTNEVMSTDVAAFPIANPGSMVPLPVASSRPKVGDMVWLVAAIVGQKSGELQHPARIVLSDDDALVFEYVDPTIELRATSGAPILSGKGEVVGINLSGGKNGTKLIGTAGSIPNLRKQIAAALQRP